MHEVGGNFGTRGSFNPEFALVVLGGAQRSAGRSNGPASAARRSSATTRRATSRSRPSWRSTATAHFLAMRGSNIANVGAYPISYGPLAKGVEIMSSIYHVPAVHFRARAAITNTLPTRPYRSSGRPEVMFVMERLIDLAARQSGFDRLELRRRNLVPESAMPYRNPFGMVYDSGAYHRVMERVVALGDWAGFPARRAEARARGKYRGIGVSQLRRHRDRHAARDAPKSRYCRTAWSRSSSAPSRTARVTRPALRS